MDRFLTLAGLALRAGRTAVGETPVYEALAQGRAKAVFLASDAGEHTGRKLAGKLGEVPLVPIPHTKAQLGYALGRGSCALLAVTDAGLTEGLRKALEDRQDQDGGVAI